MRARCVWLENVGEDNQKFQSVQHIHPLTTRFLYATCAIDWSTSVNKVLLCTENSSGALLRRWLNFFLNVPVRHLFCFVQINIHSLAHASKSSAMPHYLFSHLFLATLDCYLNNAREGHKKIRFLVCLYHTYPLFSVQEVSVLFSTFNLIDLLLRSVMHGILALLLPPSREVLLSLTFH